MGLCGSHKTAEDNQNDLVEQMLDQHFEKETKRVKLLLLGAGESGKSTIFKQMRHLYGKGFSPEELRDKKSVVVSNTISSMRILINEATSRGFEVNGELANSFRDEFGLEDEGLDDRVALTPERGALFGKLWADAGILAAYEQRNLFQLPDSAQYFFDNLDRIADNDYQPTLKDVLRTRVRTSGIVEEQYDIKQVEFVMYDVGGQRNERKKWMHIFDNVTAVIFVAAISEYDQVCFEDNTQNRVTEALTLFQEICNSKWFETTAMILFLNKRDLFEEKIKHVDMRCLFPDYRGGCDKKNAKEYLKERFMECNEQEAKDLYIHVTCATDSKNVEHVFNACTDVILKQNLKGSGFLD